MANWTRYSRSDDAYSYCRVEDEQPHAEMHPLPVNLSLRDMVDDNIQLDALERSPQIDSCRLGSDVFVANHASDSSSPPSPSVGISVVSVGSTQMLTEGKKENENSTSACNSVKHIDTEVEAAQRSPSSVSVEHLGKNKVPTLIAHYESFLSGPGTEPLRFETKASPTSMLLDSSRGEADSSQACGREPCS